MSNELRRTLSIISLQLSYGSTRIITIVILWKYAYNVSLHALGGGRLVVGDGSDALGSGGKALEALDVANEGSVIKKNAVVH